MDAAELAGLDLVADLNAADRDRVAAAAERRSFAAGQEILREGEVGDAFYLILSGRVAVSRAGASLATLHEGTFFGELGALDAGPGYAMARAATVRAESDVEAAVIPGERLTPLLVTMPALRSRIYDTLEQRSPD